jgi:hypothetical protein
MHKYVIIAKTLTTYFYFHLKTVILIVCMQKSKAETKVSTRREEKDSADTLGVRGAGATWQADFGMALNEADLLFYHRPRIRRMARKQPSSPRNRADLARVPAVHA